MVTAKGFGYRRKGRAAVAQIDIGKTGIRVEQNGFGALPIQRIPKQEAICND